MNEHKRNAIKQRIAKAEQRNGLYVSPSIAPASQGDGPQQDESRCAANKIVTFARENPLATVAGGMVVGAALAALLKGSRRTALAKSSGTAGLVAIGSEIAVAFARQIFESTQQPQSTESGGAGGAKAEAPQFVGQMLTAMLRLIRSRS